MHHVQCHVSYVQVPCVREWSIVKQGGSGGERHSYGVW